MHERHPSFEEPDSDPEEYRYIVPSGVHVVFRDHDGNEITRFVKEPAAMRTELTVDIGSVNQAPFLEDDRGGT